MNEPHDEIVVGLALIAMLAGTFALVRFRLEQQPIVVFDVALRECSVADVAGWTRFFMSLQALERPGWRGVLFGQPCLAFEFRSVEGTVRARCAVPSGQAQLVGALLRSAIDGIETSGGR